jgi:endonuclease YncB( thermonuclease family)
MDGRLYTVRYTGVDAPAARHPTRGVEPFGHEATERGRQPVEGNTVHLE